MKRPTKRQTAIGVACVAAVSTGFGVTTLLLGGDGPATPTTHPGPVAKNVLTGKPGAAGRVLAVKVDNAAPARPQTGLNDADIVYAIQVEGGLSRLMAVYDTSHLPHTVGPVRSARETDLTLLNEYNHPDLAYSGATAGFVPVLAHTPVLVAHTGGPKFYRSSTRWAPHNEYLHPAGIAQGGNAKDIGLRFGAPPYGGGAATDTSSHMPAASFQFHWQGQHYTVSLDHRQSPWTTDNVVIQHAEVKDSPRGYTYDHGRQHEPYTDTVGSGTGKILRDGRTYDITWNRASASSPTTYVFNGKTMTLNPGRTWIVLA